jgi:hypothetical protein
MKTRFLRPRRLFGLALVGGLAILVLILSNRPTTCRGIVVSFGGYTNLPNDALRFALFSVSNQDSAPIRWRGNWVEVEGVQYQKAPTINPGLLWSTRPTLKRGGSLALAVGEPSEAGRWRFCLRFSRYTLKERLLDYAFQHNLPTKLGPLLILDCQQILNPTNFITNYSPWLGN